MENMFTMTDQRPGTSNAAVQTDSMQDSGMSLEETRLQARHHGQFITDARVLRATVRAQLKSHLRMPGGDNASMKIILEYHSIPMMAWRMLFRANSVEWHSRRDSKKSTHTGLIKSPRLLNTLLNMGAAFQYGMGACRLVVAPSSGATGRSVIAFVPMLQIWHESTSDGAMQSMLTCFLVVIDESGEMRTPPNNVFTDAEEIDIKTVLMENIRVMSDLEWPLSEVFLEHLDVWEAAVLEAETDLLGLGW